jgi:hypothetical protein
LPEGFSVILTVVCNSEFSQHEISASHRPRTDWGEENRQAESVFYFAVRCFMLVGVIGHVVCKARVCDCTKPVFRLHFLRKLIPIVIIRVLQKSSLFLLGVRINEVTYETFKCLRRLCPSCKSSNEQTLYYITFTKAFLGYIPSEIFVALFFTPN